MGTVLTHCGIIPDAEGFLEFDESVDSCITATLTFISSTTSSSVILLPIPLALSCKTLNVLSSQICSAEGAGVGGGEGGGGADYWVFEAEHGSQAQSLFLRYCATFKSPEYVHAPIQNICCTGILLPN